MMNPLLPQQITPTNSLTLTNHTLNLTLTLTHTLNLTLTLTLILRADPATPVTPMMRQGKGGQFEVRYGFEALNVTLETLSTFPCVLWS